MTLRAVLAVWFGVVIIAQPARARADAAEVEALIAKGNDLRRAGTPGPALPYFQKAYELARTPRTTGQLGLAELAAGYPVEAAEHLAAALQSPNDPSIVKYRQMLADALAMARSQIGELAIQGGPAGAEVVIDGRTVGVLPLPSAIKLAARNTEVVVRAPGHSPHRELVPIAGSQHHALTVNLEKSERAEKPAEPIVTPAASPVPATAASAPATPATLVVDEHPSDSGSSPGLRTGAWIVGAAAVVAAGTGLALQLAANSKSTDFNASCTNAPMGGIMHLATSSLSDAQCRDVHDSWMSDRRWSIVSYVSGAALAVTSGVLFWTSRPTSPAAGTHAHLTCSPTAHGLTCQGIF